MENYLCSRAALYFRCLDWSILVGKEVQILHGGKLIRAGRVDAASPDGLILWLARDGVFDRKLIQRTDGFEAWVAKPMVAAPGADEPFQPLLIRVIAIGTSTCGVFCRVIARSWTSEGATLILVSMGSLMDARITP